MTPAWVQTVRDVAIVMLALESILIGAMILVLVIQIKKLISVMEEEVKPLLISLNETVGTVRGTTSFVSKSIVSPTIQALSFGAALKQGASAVFRRRGR